MRRKTVTRAGTLVLAAALALTVNAAALLGGGETPAAETALTALPAEVRTYRDTAVQGRLQAEGGAGETLTYALAEAPKKGAVKIEGDTFTYTPSEGRTGKDTFTYTAADGEGNVSEPAEVTVTIEKPRSGVTYADTAGSPAAAAAQELAELGVFTGPLRHPVPFRSVRHCSDLLPAVHPPLLLQMHRKLHRRRQSVPWQLPW